MNYTRPNDDEHNDEPKDWLLGALLFAKAISFLLHEGEGIVINLTGDMVELYPEAKKVIVANDGEQIKIINADDRVELKEGDWVKVINEENILN